MRTFDPAAVAELVIRDWAVVEGALHLRYRLGALELHEEVELAVPIERVVADPRGAAVADLLLLAAGTSYYKAAAPSRIVVDGIEPTEPALELARHLYQDGLAEFRWVNGLALRPDLELVATAAPGRADPPAAGPAPTRPVVPVGGGKDSIVTVELLRAGGAAPTLFTVGEHGPLARTAAVARRPRVTATRRIDPKLFELNAAGAYNGHVPITAITSLIALLSAVGLGADAVVMSNEHSASTPTIVVDGVGVNHQFSKSVTFESLLRAALAAGGVSGLDYFSLLRPMSELAILRAFAQHDRYHGVFVSCNSNYSVAGGAEHASRWCGHCPKCLFVYLGLAPFRSVAEMVAIFGRDLLADPSLTPGFMALFALDETRPFECVGTPAECAEALRLLQRRPEWGDHAVVEALGSTTAAASPPVFTWCHPHDRHFVPEPLLALLPCG
jgi:hypothetical protein